MSEAEETGAQSGVRADPPLPEGRQPVAGRPSGPGGLTLGTSLLILVGAAVVAALLIAAGQVLLALALMMVLVAWILRDVLLTWVSGVGALLVTLIFVPSRVYSFDIPLPFDLDPYRLVLLCLVLVWLAARSVGRGIALERTYLDGGILWLLVAIGASYLFNLGHFVPADEFTYMVKNVAYAISFPLTFYVVASVVRESDHALGLIDLLIICGGVASLLAVVERSTHYNVFQHLTQFLPFLTQHAEESLPSMRGAIRVSGSTSHPIAFATMLSMLLPLGVARTFTALRPRMRWVAGVCSVAIAVGALLSLSRTGVVGMAAVLIVLLAGLPAYRRVLSVAAVLLMAGVHTMFTGVFGTLIRYFSPSFIASQEMGNENGRLVDYVRAGPDILGHPVFGQGYEMCAPSRYYYLDNQYLKTTLELGVFGLVAYVYLMWRAVSVPFREGLRIRDERGVVLIACAAAAAAYAVTSATFDTLGFPQVTYLFFAQAGLAAAIMRERSAVANR